MFSGSVVGALISLLSAWLTKKHEARVQRASENKLGRQRLYAQFMEEASKLYVDALVRDQAEAPAMVSIYALISKMRMASHANVVESAEAVIQTILRTYSRPNKTFPELQDLMLNRNSSIRCSPSARSAATSCVISHRASNNPLCAGSRRSFERT